ncbi:PepSY domain-containing protein [Oceanobacillus salinisoli]|uniref:PepSY domain-containing protein n=1 Tax=Oceanobacillus salinisoli TaxID=2678611 RepID=UPI0012E19F94|nr:hypothetical protein [Oceanobacillus salinisoli]
MGKIGFPVLFVFILFISNGCKSVSPKITEAEAESIVIEQHSGDIGEVKIISVNHKWGKYIVEWENYDNCESGMEHIDDQNGKIIKRRSDNFLI